MAFMGNFRQFMEQEMAKAIALAQAQEQRLLPPGTANVAGVGTAWRGPVAPQRGVATQYGGSPPPAPAVPQTSDRRFYEQNVNLPAPPRAFPSPHQPNLAGVTPNPADVAAIAAMLAGGGEGAAPSAQIQDPAPAPSPVRQPIPGPSDAQIRAYGDHLTSTMEDRRALDPMSVQAAMIRERLASDVRTEQGAEQLGEGPTLPDYIVDPVVELIAQEVRRLPQRAATVALDVENAAQNIRPLIESLGIPFDFILDVATRKIAEPVAPAADVVGTGAGAVVGAAESPTYDATPSSISGEPVVPGQETQGTVAQSPGTADILGELGGTAASAAGDVAGFVATEGVAPALAAPIEAAEGVTGVSPAEVADFAINTAAPMLDVPRQKVAGVLGEAAIRVIEARAVSGGTLTDFELRLIDAYENGYQVKDVNGNVIAEFGPGGRAVWEAGMGETDDWPILLRLAARGAVDIGIDPLTWLEGLGLAARGVKGAAKGARVGFLEAEDAARTAAKKGDEAAVAGDEFAESGARVEQAVAREAARDAERKAAALNAVATVLRGLNLPNEVIDRGVGFIADQIRRAGGLIPFSERQLLEDAVEEVQGTRATLGRARDEVAADAPVQEAEDATGIVMVPDPNNPGQMIPQIVDVPRRGFGPGGIGQAPQQEATDVTATLIPDQPQPRYEPAGPTGVLGEFTPAETPRQARLRPGEGPAQPGAEPLPVGPRAPRQATLADAPAQEATPATAQIVPEDPPSAAAPQPTAGEFEYEKIGETNLIYPTGDRTIRARQNPGSNGYFVEVANGDGTWTQLPGWAKSRSSAQDDLIDWMSRRGTDPRVPAPQQAAPQPSPAPAVDEVPATIDDAAGIVTFEGVDDIRVKRTGQGSRERWTVQERRPGGWRNSSEKFREQSEAVAQGRQSVLARQRDEIADAPTPGVDETSVLAREEAPPVTTRPRPLRPGEVLPPDYQYPEKVGGRSSGGKKDVNRERRREMMASLGDDVAVLPESDLQYLDPAYAKADPEAVPTFAEQVAFEYGPRNPRAARAFWAEYEPEALRFIDEDKRLARKSGGTTPEARETPERELHRVEFEARREATFRKHFGGDEAPVRESRYDTDLPNIPKGDKRNLAASGNAPDDLRAIIEQAVFGEDDVATRARGYLHAAANNPAINRALGENPSTVAKRLSNVRKELMGEEALSQTDYARRQRKKAANSEGETASAGLPVDPVARERVAKREHAASEVERKRIRSERMAATRATDEENIASGIASIDPPRKGIGEWIVDVTYGNGESRGIGYPTKAKANAAAKEMRADISPDAMGITATATADPRAWSLYRRTIRALQPEVEEAVDPGFVDNPVTEADHLYNAGHFGEEDRAWLNQEINAPQVKQNKDGEWYDAGWGSKKRAGTFTRGESERLGVVQPDEGAPIQLTARGREVGKTTVLDAIDDLWARGVGDEDINRFIGRLIAEARGVNVASAIRESSKFAKAFHGWNQFVRQNTQFWIGRIAAGYFQDAVSDAWAGVVNGMPGIGLRQFNPKLNWRTFQSVAGSQGGDDILRQMPVFRYINDLGDDVPVELSALGQGRVDTPLSGETIAGKLLGTDVTIRGKPVRVGVGGLVSSRWARDLRTTGDRVRRFLAFDHTLKAEMRDASQRFDALLVAQAERRGVPMADWHRAINDAMAGKVAFSPDDLRRAIPGGDGEMLARTWRREIKQARNKAKAKVEKMYFSYRQTKADDIIRHATFFHYWMTRAAAMHGEMALRNPWLMATYYRMWEGLKDNAEREGYPDTLKSYIRFMGESLMGGHAYVDPLSFLVPFTMFREMGSEYAKPWEKMGLFLNPFAEAVLGAFGVSENIPNLLGTGSLERRVAAVLDHMEADGIGDGQPVQSWTRRVGEALVRDANAILRAGKIPGVREFQPFDPNMYYRDQMIHLIEHRAEQEYGPRDGWTSEQQAQVDEAKELVGVDARKNPLSDWAHEQWTRQSFWGQAFAWLVPARIRTAVRDENKVLAGQGMDAITDGDPDTEPTPEQQAALDIGAQAQSGDPVLVSQDQRYRGLGTDRQRELAALHRGLAYEGNEGQLPTRELISGQRVLDIPAPQVTGNPLLGTGPAPAPAPVVVDDLAGMTGDERFDVADRVIEQLGGTQEFANYRLQREQFREENPRYAQYNDWQSQMYDYPGGPLAAAEELRRFSPNFDTYLRGEEQHGELTEGDVTGVEAYLAQQGEQYNVYEEAKPATDVSAIPASNFLFGADGGGGGGDESSSSSTKKPKKPAKTDAEKEIDRIAEDLAEAEAYAEAVQAVIDETNPGVPYEQLERGSRTFVDNQMRRQGVSPPRMSEEAELYLAWRANVPPGEDRSIAAFVRYMAELEKGQK